MKKFLLLIITCFLFIYTQAQSIQGTIKNTSGSPIAGASIGILNQEIKSVSDSKGYFNIKQLPNGNQMLFITATGYSSQVKTIVIEQKKVSEIEIVLVEETKELDEVVVTASKREENILRVPTSITSLSEKKLTDTRTWGLSGLTALIPNYSYQQLGVSFQQIQSIRGVQVFSENPAVSTYIDDVNNIDILANGFAFTDVERIEVLRGPQGTLFGRNAMGGVINIITKKSNNQLIRC